MAIENEISGNTPEAVKAAEALKVAEAVKAAEASADAEMKAASDKAAADKTALGDKGDSELISKIVKERLDVELANIKGKLDGAYKQRDEYQAKIAAFESKEREATLKRLSEEGKHKEAYEIQLAEERAANATLAKRNTELSRDVSVRESLRSLSFRNDKAANMAFQEITSNLVQDEHKQWVHRSGISVKEYCEAFSKDEEQSFLFKAKVNSGAGTASGNSGNGVPGDNKPKSLFAMSQADVIKMASEGKLGTPPRY